MSGYQLHPEAEDELYAAAAYYEDCVPGLGIYAAAGESSVWEISVAEIRREHGRKYGFMPGFERVVAGGPAVEAQPSFLERARSRWPRGER